MTRLPFLVICLLAGNSWCTAFSPLSRPVRSNSVVPIIHLASTTTTPTAAALSPLFGVRTNKDDDDGDDDDDNNNKSTFLSLIRQRLDTLSSAGIDNARTAGPFSRIKKIHNPITYLILAAVAGFRWDWCFRNPYYWFAVGFCIKWYRARYVFKIPVWDRQPNWNNIITSKEQEKDLKAFTCKKCGSTLFIAKTREFFFEGNTGIGGLGCFTCGAKGKENFVMDRDRIVEDVADEDDYFEYERPLDFVSRAERRKLMKEAAGDEEKANEMLLKRQQTEQGGDETSNASAEVIDVETTSPTESTETVEEAIKEEDKEATTDEQPESPPSPPTEALNGDSPEAKQQDEAPSTEAATSKTEKKPKKKSKTPPPPANDDDIFDTLDMDA